MNNREWLNSLSNEELVEMRIIKPCKFTPNSTCLNEYCDECIKEWLEWEHK